MAKKERAYTVVLTYNITAEDEDELEDIVRGHLICPDIEPVSARFHESASWAERYFPCFSHLCCGVDLLRMRCSLAATVGGLAMAVATAGMAGGLIGLP